MTRNEAGSQTESGQAESRQAGLGQAGLGQAGLGQAGPSTDGLTLSQAQITQGLRWLARRMEQHGQPIFFVEQLQPNWLPSLGQRWLYLLAFSLILGSVTAFFMAFSWILAVTIDGEFVAEILPLRLWVTVTVLWYLTIGARDLLLRPEAGPTPSGLRLSFWQQLRGMGFYFAFWAALWLAAWGALVLTGNLEPDATGIAGWLSWASPALSAGAVLSGVYQVRAGGPGLINRVRPVEALGWSLEHAIWGVGFGCAAAVAIWLLTGLLSLTQGSSVILRQGLIFYLPIGAAFGALLGGLQMCFHRRPSRPNEGICLSARNGLRSFLIAWPVLTLATWLGIRLRGFETPPPEVHPWYAFIHLWGDLSGALLGALLSAATIGLWFGGVEVLRHWVVRLALATAGPRHLMRFLDQAVHPLGLLRRIGGGYQFLHRLLLEHFARSDSQSEPEDVSSVDSSF